jgi:hypothetical protein
MPDEPSMDTGRGRKELPTRYVRRLVIRYNLDHLLRSFAIAEDIVLLVLVLQMLYHFERFPK